MSCSFPTWQSHNGYRQHILSAKCSMDNKVCRLRKLHENNPKPSQCKRLTALQHELAALHQESCHGGWTHVEPHRQQNQAGFEPQKVGRLSCLWVILCHGKVQQLWPGWQDKLKLMTVPIHLLYPNQQDTDESIYQIRSSISHWEWVLNLNLEKEKTNTFTWTIIITLEEHGIRNWFLHHVKVISKSFGVLIGGIHNIMIQPELISLSTGFKQKGETCFYCR